VPGPGGETPLHARTPRAHLQDVRPLPGGACPTSLLRTGLERSSKGRRRPIRLVAMSGGACPPTALQRACRIRRHPIRTKSTVLGCRVEGLRPAGLRQRLHRITPTTGCSSQTGHPPSRESEAGGVVHHLVVSSSTSERHLRRAGTREEQLVLGRAVANPPCRSDSVL
jgi:hypothetical protein